jgi:hypothetical protein
MDMEWGLVTTMRGERIARIENYDDRAQALKAVGLMEGTRPPPESGL